MEDEKQQEREVLPGGACPPIGGRPLPTILREACTANIFIERHPYLVGYSFLFALILVAATHSTNMFLMSFLFLYLISDFMTNDVGRRIPWVPRALLFSILYLLVITIITLLTYRVIPAVIKQFPELTGQAQGEVVRQLRELAQRYDLLQYVDMDEFRAAVAGAGASVLRFTMDNLHPVYKGFIQFIFALVLNVFLYRDQERIEEVFTRKPGSMMNFIYHFTEYRLRLFYFYFRRVMGGQIIIATINTVISATVVFGLGLPHPFLMIFIIFFCGLFPVVGNLVSNSVLVLNALMAVGLWAAGICLILLIVIHKLEYFLNSRIIGGIVRLPMAITLASLIGFEMLFGIPGLILAIPLTLFLRHELEHLSGLPECEPSTDDPEETM